MHPQSSTTSDHHPTGSTTRINTIQKFIDDKIAPGVRAHGGDVIIQSLEDNVLTLALTGACGSCGVQAYTSESISNYILEEFADLEDVIVEQ